MDVRQDKLLVQENSIERLFNHFIKESQGNPIPFRRWDKFDLFLEILGGSGGIYAWPSAWMYSKDMKPWLAYSFAVTNPLSNVLFLIRAADNLFDKIQLELGNNQHLNDLMDLPTKEQLVAKYGKIALGSIVCIIPFGIAVYMFPPPNCNSTWCSSVTITHSVVSNIILHAVSWDLIFSPEYWYYRLPFLPFEKLFACLKNKSYEPHEIVMTQLQQEQQSIYAEYKTLLCSSFSNAAAHIVNHYLKNKEFPALQDDNMHLLNYIELYNPLDQPPQQETFLNTIINKTHSILAQGSSIFGAAVMVTGCIGWIVNPYYVALKEGLHLPESIVTGSLPAYSTAVLCAFYGSGVFSQIYRYLTTWTGIRDKFSYEAQLYPKTFTLYLLINIYVSTFAYATGYQLIETIFADPMWDEVRLVLQDISIPTLQILSFIPLLELFNLVIRKSIAKFGSLDKDETLAARLLLKTDCLIQHLQHMKGEELITSLKQFSPQQLGALRIEPGKFQRDAEHLTQLQTQMDDLPQKPIISSAKNRNGLFCCKSDSEEDVTRGLLSVNSP